MGIISNISCFPSLFLAVAYLSCFNLWQNMNYNLGSLLHFVSTYKFRKLLKIAVWWPEMNARFRRRWYSIGVAVLKQPATWSWCPSPCRVATGHSYLLRHPLALAFLDVLQHALYLASFAFPRFERNDHLARRYQPQMLAFQAKIHITNILVETKTRPKNKTLWNARFYCDQN